MNQMKTPKAINLVNKCLYCYEALENRIDFHEKCSLEFFVTSNSPTIEYSLGEMEELAKQIVERSIAVPDVQPKLSMSLLKGTTNNPNSILTVIGIDNWKGNHDGFAYFTYCW
ncbi:MAG: hypothetical protein WED33_06440 [Bacteroidia bacterium]